MNTTDLGTDLVSDLRKQQQQRKTIPQNIGLHKKNNGILVH
jgi:hypothetical protein